MMTDMGAGQGYDGKVAQGGVLSGLLHARDQARLEQGAAPSLPHPQPVTVSRAAMNAVARAVNGLYQLPISTLEISPAAITLAEMAELLPQPALLSVVEGMGEAIGVVAICPNLMAALIEMQTLGRITARPCDSRRPTRSDAIICADFVNALLDELGREITQIDGFEAFGGFRYASFLDDQRPLLLMLDDSPYRSLRYRLRFGRDPGREGEIFVALPQKRTIAALPSPVAGIAMPDETKAAATPTANGDLNMSDRVHEASVDIVGVLCRKTVKLGDLRRLRPGQIFPLSRVDLSDTRLETQLGQLLATGKLGEVDGYHAIRLRAAEREGADHSPHDTDGAVAHMGSAIAKRALVPPEIAAQHIANVAAEAKPEPPIADLDLPDGFRAKSGMAGSAPSVDADNGGQIDAMSVKLQQKAAI